MYHLIALLGYLQPPGLPSKTATKQSKAHIWHKTHSFVCHCSVAAIMPSLTSNLSLSIDHQETVLNPGAGLKI
jgi:hypothetical protein